MRRLLAAGMVAGLVAALARRRLDVVEVRGRSMLPTLLPGDRLLVVRATGRVGDVVLAPVPGHQGREMVKRIEAIDGIGIHLRGDNPVASTDARAFGPLPASAVRWRAVCRYWPPSRAGRLPGPPDALERLDAGGEPACAFPDALIAGGGPD